MDNDLISRSALKAQIKQVKWLRSPELKEIVHLVNTAPAVDAARDMTPRKAYKLDGFWCKICRKQHTRVVEVDGIYLTQEAAEEALEARDNEG